MAADAGTAGNSSWWIRAYEGLNALVGRAHESPSFAEQMRAQVAWRDWMYTGATDQPDYQAAFDIWAQNAIESAQSASKPGAEMPVNPYTGKPWFIEGDLRPLRPTVPSPTIPGPTVSTPPAVIQPGPRVVTGEVLSEADRIVYEMNKEAARTLETMGKFGGRGAVGGALRLGAAIWSEFGAEILAENAAKAEAAAQRDAQLRKGPRTRRAKTAKRGKIRRTQPPQPPGLGDSVKPPPRREPPRSINQRKIDQPINAPIDQARKAEKAAETAAKAAKSAKGPSSSSARSPKFSQNVKLSSLTRPELAGVALTAAASALVAGAKSLASGTSSAVSSLVESASQPRTQTGSGGSLFTRTQARTTEGNQKCYTVCRKTNQKRKKKKRDRRVCVDKGTLTKFVNSIRK